MTKKSKDTSKSKGEKDSANRGRPSTKEKDNTSKAKDNSKSETPKAEKSKAEKPKNEKPIVNKPKAKELSAEEIAEQEKSSLISSIYGDGALQNIVPFPDSTLQTQTKNIITEFAIDVARLPQNIADAVNALVGDFTAFVTNPMMIGTIPVIMDKDLTALNLLRAWVEPRKAMLSDLKFKTQGGIKTTNANPNVVVPAQNPTGMNVNTNPNPSVTVSNVPVDNNQNIPLHNQNNFMPRNPESTYQHNISHPNPLGGANPMGTSENKNIHYEMLTKANPEILKQHHAQQNPVFNPTPVYLDPEKQLIDYTTSVMDAIKSTFQMIHWGYIPLDVLQGVLQTCNKSYSYEVISSGKESYINISNGTHNASTDKFAIQ